MTLAPVFAASWCWYSPRSGALGTWLSTRSSVTSGTASSAIGMYSLGFVTV